MGTLTIRTTDEQDQIIEHIQQLLGESAVSKTLLRCVAEYQKLSSTLEDQNLKLKEALNRVDELENVISNYLNSQHALMSVVSSRTNKVTQKQNKAPAQVAKQNLNKILETLR
ncbi:hypothetical protein [Neisseria sp. Ec49-e6-T10]|uniref:hypothetical protein n=1 Tax=Neisseria sp. Ec49-e6-T10 TaxID=3140744 RepID=UPI003EBF8AB2